MTKAQLTRAALILLAIAAAPVGAATDLSLPRFEAVSLKGGGHVLLRHGPRQQVRILRGDATVSSFEVKNRSSLEIRACEDRCPRDYKLEVEIVTPDVSALAVQGGGLVETQGSFPARSSLALSVQGGGTIDSESVEARQVAASVDGGGLIRTRASTSLAASIRGGGLVTYRGEPSVATSVHGGGLVRRADQR